MRKTNKTIGALAAITALTAGVAMAGLQDIKGDLYAGYATQYNFRGVNLGDDLAEAGFNLSTECPLTQGTISLGVWYGSLNDSPSLANNQLNTSLGWNKDLGAFDLGLGFINYDHNGSIFGDTNEVYLTLGADLFAGIRGAVAVYYDLDDADGWYIEPTLSKSIKLNECVSLDLSAGAGFYQSYAGALEGTNHWFIGAALPWQARQNLTITPYVKYVDVSSGHLSGYDFTAGSATAGEDEVIGGVRASVSF